MKFNCLIALVLVLASVQCHGNGPMVQKFLSLFEGEKLKEQTKNDHFAYIFKIDNTSEESVEDAIADLNANRNQVKNLEIQLVHCNQEVDLSSIQSLENLEKINFIYLYGKCNLQGLEFLESSQKLSKLSVSVLGTSRQNISGLKVIENLSSLKSINLNIRLSSFESDIIDLSQLIFLEELYISHEMNQKYNFQGLINLSVLNLSYGGTFFENLDFLNSLIGSPNLISLSLDYSFNNNKHFSDLESLRFISKLTNLKSLELNLSHFQYYSIDGGVRTSHKILRDISAISDFKTLQSLQSLKLDISQNTIQDFESLVNGIFPLPSLNTLEINCKSNKESDQKYGYPNIKKIFDQKYQNSIEHYSFE